MICDCFFSHLKLSLQKYTVNPDLVIHGSLNKNLEFLQSYIEKLRKDPPPYFITDILFIFGRVKLGFFHFRRPKLYHGPTWDRSNLANGLSSENYFMQKNSYYEILNWVFLVFYLIF